MDLPKVSRLAGWNSGEFTMKRRTILRHTPGPSKLLLLLFFALTVAACDGASRPQVIATYPRQGGAAAGSIVRSAEVELAVYDAGAAAERVSRLVVTHGGYVVDSQSWTWQGREQARVTVSVPAREFDSFYRALVTFGSVVSERVTEVVGGNPQRFTEVSVTLRSSRRPIAPADARGWQPADTFRAAFAVFTRLFQALVDGVIWVAVVAGPFLLMALGLASLVRRLRRGRDEDGRAGGGDEVS